MKINARYNILEGNGEKEFLFYLTKFLRGEKEFEGDSYDLAKDKSEDEIKSLAPFLPADAICEELLRYVQRDIIINEDTFSGVDITVSPLQDFVEKYTEEEVSHDDVDIDIMEYTILDAQEKGRDFASFIVIRKYSKSIAVGIFDYDRNRFLLSVRSDLFGTWPNADPITVGKLMGIIPQENQA